MHLSHSRGESRYAGYVVKLMSMSLSTVEVPVMLKEANKLGKSGQIHWVNLLTQTEIGLQS